MRIQSILLVGMLALASCGPTEPPAPQPTAPPAASAPTDVPPPATAPAVAMPTMTAVPAAPRATATNVPTALPAATAEPAPTDPPVATAEPLPEPIRMLSPKLPWVRVGSTISAPGDTGGTIDLQALNFPAIMGDAAAAADGAYVAYVDLQDQLTLLDMGGSTQTLPQSRDVHPVGFEFSPDGSALAYALTNGQTWQLQTLDIRSGAVRTLQEGATIVAEQQGILAPLAWTPAGVLAERIFWATDAPPQELVLVNPSDGSLRSLREDAHLRAVASPDGAKVALVTGLVPIGETPKFMISVLDVASGNEISIVPEQPGFVKALHWSPDGALLLYAMSESYETSITSVVALNADGTNAQQVDFGVQGFELAFHDLGWLDAQTPLVLVASGAQVELHALPLNSFDATGLRPIGTFPAPADQQAQLLYVPGAGV
jgi:hypothetical protein